MTVPSDRPQQKPPADYLIGSLGPIFDDEGRPLDEGKTPAELRPDVPLVLERCPYAGSRATSALPMNTSALDQARRHLREALADLAFLRREYVAHHGSHELTAADLWHLTMVTSHVPRFLVGRADDKLGVIPAHVAVMYKMMAGVRLVCDQLAWHELVGLPTPPLTAAALFERTEQRGFLVGRAEVCAGTESMIRRTLDVLVRGAPYERAGLQALVPVTEAMFRFGACILDAVVLLRMLDLIAICVARDLGAEPGTPRGDAVLGSRRPRFVSDLGLGISELPLAARADEIARPAALLVTVSTRSDDELTSVVDALTELWRDPSRAPDDVYIAGERAIVAGVAALRREARQALGQAAPDEPIADPGSIGIDWARTLASLRDR